MAVVDFYERSGLREMVLLGGEPCLHSRFMDILHAGREELLRVSGDDGHPAGSDTNSFQVIVDDYLQMTVGGGTVAAGQTGSVPVVVSSSVSVTNANSPFSMKCMSVGQEFNVNSSAAPYQTNSQFLANSFFVNPPPFCEIKIHQRGLQKIIFQRHVTDPIPKTAKNRKPSKTDCASLPP